MEMKLSLFLHPLVLLYGMDLKDATEGDGGRGCGTWAGHLRHRRNSGLLGFNGRESKTTPKALRHRSAGVKTRPPAGVGRGLAPPRRERAQQHLR